MKGEWQECGYRIKYNITKEKKDKIIEILLNYYEANGHSWEILAQEDEALLQSIPLLGCMADEIIEFEYEEIQEKCFVKEAKKSKRRKKNGN